MKTYVTDDYQVTLMDNGGVKVIITVYTTTNIIIRYNPDNKKPWDITMFGNTKRINNLTDLGLGKFNLETIRKALEVVGKQDLFDDEIVFVNDEEK